MVEIFCINFFGVEKSQREKVEGDTFSFEKFGIDFSERVTKLIGEEQVVILFTEKEIQKIEKEIEKRMFEIFSLVEELLGDDEISFLNDKIFDFSNKIRELFPDKKYCYAHEVLIGSSPELEKIRYLDFPEPYSVESFLKKYKDELMNLRNS